jgi:hypothetical protein
MMAQELIAAKSAELHQIADEVVTLVSDGVREGMPIHEVELKVFRRLLGAGHAALQLLVDSLGDGDLGEEHQLPDGRTVKRSPDVQKRPYVSIFGELDIKRYVYLEREGQKIELAAVDARLGLPEGKFSYVLQDWDQSFAMEQPFAKVNQTVERILGLKQHVDSLEHTNRKMAQKVESFHFSQEAPPADEEGAILVETADGKGIPIRQSADAPAIHDHGRRKGPKPGRKRMATIGAVYSIDPFHRTPDEVVASLFRDPRQKQPKRSRPRPCHKRMRAILNHTNAAGEEIDGRASVFRWISGEMAQRHAEGKPIVCIMDGEQSLWSMRDAVQEDISMVDVLDLLHVTPRLWDAASVFYSRDSAAAENFVKDRVLRILRGEVGSVIRGLRRMGTTHGLHGKKSTDLKTICGYFEKNRHRMRYDEYLAAGYPIASGVIEGACRHVVKDRLERTGMNWIREGAQAMLDLRCVYLTDQWDEFNVFRIETETKRLYPYRQTLEPVPWATAA